MGRKQGKLARLDRVANPSLCSRRLSLWVVLMQKTYEPELDQLIEELKSSWDITPGSSPTMVVDADVAERAAEMIFRLYQRLSSFEAEDYNRQMGDY
jgi:hypothetical protein